MKKYDTQRIKVRLPDATISHFPALFCQNEADILFNQLKTQLTWKQEDIKFSEKYANSRDLLAGAVIK